MNTLPRMRRGFGELLRQLHALLPSTIPSQSSMDSHTKDNMKSDFDVIIVGAGISGINTAYRIQSELQGYSYVIVEGREAIGGTWDLFRYPGVRSDSDLFTFSFSWHPWNLDNPIAEGGAIVKYMKETATLYGIDKHILFKHKVVTASWSSANQSWTLAIDHDGERKSFTARFVIFSTGYYDYRQPLQAQIPGIDNFKGPVVHPQFWPEDLDYSGKNIVVIGSGATAITLVPNLAKQASHVTMLQRSPTYILSLPNPATKGWVDRLLPTTVSDRLKRLRWILSSQLFYHFCRRFPGTARRILRGLTRKQLPGHIPFDPHFNPGYNPWDQRLCFCPDGDFYRSLHTGKVDVQTDKITQVTEKDIRLHSGKVLGADIIVTATGLKLQMAGGIELKIDGREVVVSEKYMWRGMMLQDVPNAVFVIGYTNASWTLGADATSLFVCRLLRRMEKKTLKVAIPRLGMSEEMRLSRRKVLNINSTYVKAAENALPKAADRGPWKPRDDYLSDRTLGGFKKLDDGLELL